jgi:hypothetical protein
MRLCFTGNGRYLALPCKPYVLVFGGKSREQRKPNKGSYNIVSDVSHDPEV